MTPRRIFLLIIIGIIGFGLLTGPRHQQMLVQCHDSPGVPFLEVLVSKSGFKESTSSLAICNRFGSTTNRAPTIPKTTKHSYTQASESSVQGLKDNFVAHAPITIQNNTDFLTQASNEGWSGTGIATDPIIITGYSITSLTSILLEISYTTLHFEVRNNVFNGVNRTYDAIHLKNVKNGVIANNTVYYSKNAIYFFADTRMTYTTIANNTIESNQVGIYLYSADIDLFGNKLIDNLEAGIFLGWVFASSIKDNVLVNNGLDATYIHDSQVSNNSVNGKPLVYWQNINGGTIPNGAGQVVLVNCNTVTVSNQVLTNASVGIIAFSCSNLNISSNILANNSKYGILAGGSTSSTVITNNTFLNNKYAGIRVADGKGTIENNILRNNGFGIRMHSPRFFIISNNSLINNHVGICSSKAYIGDDGFLDITTNIIANNSWGIYLTNPYLYISMEFTIRNNTIANNTVNGIKLSNSNSNLIWGNTLIENTQYGIILDRASAGNRILWNTFINNHGNGSSQAYDGGNTNTFSYNYWSEWVSPDANNDGIVDNPYLIEGEALNKDFYPVISRYYLSVPKILYPKDNETLHGIVTFQWTALNNSLANYTLYYTQGTSIDWEALATNLTTANYSWDTRQVPDGINYFVKVVMIFPGALTIESPARVFIIQNQDYFNQLFMYAFIFGISIGVISGFVALILLIMYFRRPKELAEAELICYKFFDSITFKVIE